MARRHILRRVEGDTQPDISIEFEGFDLTGFTVKMHTKTTGSSSTQTQDAIIDTATPTGSTFHVELAPSDQVLRRGKHEIEFEFTDVSGNFTIPKDNTIIVETRADIR